jgi:hypothetical protein
VPKPKHDPAGSCGLIFLVPKIPFPVFSPKIPCSDAQRIPSKVPGFSDHFGNMDTATGQSS